MSYVREFRGFAGIRLEADDIGSADDPSILLLHGGDRREKFGLTLPTRFNKPVAMLSASICAGMAAAIGRMMGAMTLTPMSRICVPFWRKCGRGP